MSNIDRSFSITNERILDYLASGQFAQDLEDLALYDDSKNVDTDAMFALIRRMEFILPDYENILAESIVDSDIFVLDPNRTVYAITETLIPALIRVFRQQHRRLNRSECEQARLMLLFIVAKCHGVRTLVMCWLMNRISVESAVDYEVCVASS